MRLIFHQLIFICFLVICFNVFAVTAASESMLTTRKFLQGSICLIVCLLILIAF